MKKTASHHCFGGAVEFYEHASTSTQTTMKFSVFLPRPDQKPDGCIVWLSGLTCTEQNFITKAGAQAHLANTNHMIICPDTSPRGLDLPNEHDAYDFGSGAGFYVNATTPGYKDHYQMYDYINEELHTIIQDQFSIKPNAISISGHSMGGHGALIIGLKNPDKYAAISAFSPIVHPTQCPWGQKAFEGYLGKGDQDVWKQWDATALLKAGHSHPKTILIDQGTDDEFLDQLMTRDFADACALHGQNASIRYQEGYDHSYYFISSFIKDHIDHLTNK